FAFEDLGNAVRKIAIDLGVTVRFPHLSVLEKRPAKGDDKKMVGPNVPYHTIGEIDYPAADGTSDKGLILYIKPSFHGTESADICSYAIAHKSFPHEDTANQWFTESQFESYRALGFKITDDLLGDALGGLKNPQAALVEILTWLRDHTPNPR